MSTDPRHGMFILQGDRLIGLDETPYDSEGLLQRFLAQYPDLLAGHQIDPQVPRRWLLIDREVGIPDAPEGGGRWSLDHLFLDQDAVPTLVEVKRSTDTRIRREVVGQVLEYAANALAYLPVERIRGVFEAQCAKAGQEPAEVLAVFLGEGADGESYWDQVAENVRVRRLRLVFAADEIPPELERIVEYLNEQMRTTEVLAVELKQYRGGDLTTLVPRVLGRTSEAIATKQKWIPGAKWDWDRFATALGASSGIDAVRRARLLYDWGQARTDVWWGNGTRFGGFVPIYTDASGVRHQLFEVWTNGLIEIYFKYLGGKGPFVAPELRSELRERLVAIPGVEIPVSALGKLPNIQLASLDDAGTRRIAKTFDWVISTIAGGPHRRGRSG